MTRFIKKAAAAVLSFAMLASSAVVLNNTAIAEDGFVLTASAATSSDDIITIDHVIYKIYTSEDRADVIGTDGVASHIVIPQQVRVPGTNTYKTVKSIADLAFQGKTHLYTVKIQAKITTLPDHAFYGCRNLWKVVVPPTLPSVPAYAFAFTRIKSINLPYACKSIGSYAFAGCTELRTIILHRPNMLIASTAFHGCIPSNWKTYTYPGTARNYLKNIGSKENYLLRNGDVDGDGMVTEADAELILEEYVTVGVAGGDSILTAKQRLWGDVDGDYEITALDAQYVQKALMAAGSDTPQNFEVSLYQYAYGGSVGTIR